MTYQRNETPEPLAQNEDLSYASGGYIVQSLANAWKAGFEGKPYPGTASDKRAIEVYKEGKTARIVRNKLLQSSTRQS
jgi:hypothetical protein